MFVPHGFCIGPVMMITSAIVGALGNTYTRCEDYVSNCFYWDYARRIFLISLVLAFTMEVLE